uniref:Peptidase M60 domain-containing protein n=1 Tax=Knipowitschia caucasica TaxID=637954 RepID=A0AAV2J3V8_KNICA
MNEFNSSLGDGVYVTDAYCVEGKEKELIAFMKSGGGVLIAGQAWSWAEGRPKDNPLLHFPGNKVAGVAGVYFSKHRGDAECIPVFPTIPASWMSVVTGMDYEDDLEFLLQGISEFDIKGVVASEILIHGPLAFPIGTMPDGSAFLAGAYYGKGRVMVMSHENLLKRETFAPFINNALHWLDEGRQGVVGVFPNLYQAKVFKEFDLKCEKTELRKDLSVYVCMVYKDEKVEEIQEFVAEGGGLLIAGQAWHWAQNHKGAHFMTDFAGNKILNKMGMTLWNTKITGTDPVPNQAKNDTYYFRHVLHKFTRHVTQGEELTAHEEEWLNKLGGDCTKYLNLDACNNNFNQIMSTFTEIIKKAGLPKVCEKCPVKSERDKFLLKIGEVLYKKHHNPEELLPFLIKDNPLLPVLYNQNISIDTDTGGGEEWVSTGLYLAPGMKTYLTVPANVIDKGLKVQIGCQMDSISEAKVLKRAPCVCERFPVTSEMLLVHNLWGGLIYFIVPPKTKVAFTAVAQMAVPAPYYKSGETSLSDWSLLSKAPSPWAELEFENVILTVPSEVIRNLERPDELAELWDKMLRAVADLAAIPPKFKRKERFVCEVQISHGWMHAGYPIMAHKASAQQMVSVKHATTKGLWGPLHELGHNRQRGCWEFPPHTTEATCNLWPLYVHETVLNLKGSRGKEQPKYVEKYITNGRNLSQWHVWTALETYLQLKDKFGWDAHKKVFAAYHNMSGFPKNRDGKMNLYAVTFSEIVGMDLSGFFKAWGWPIEGDTEKKLSNLPAWIDHPMAQYN